MIGGSADPTDEKWHPAFAPRLSSPKSGSTERLRNQDYPARRIIDRIWEQPGSALTRW